MDKIYAVARNMVDTSYDQLPPEVVEVTKTLIMDSLAVGLCGSSEAGVSELLGLFEDWGGKEGEYGLEIHQYVQS